MSRATNPDFVVVSIPPVTTYEGAKKTVKGAGADDTLHLYHRHSAIVNLLESHKVSSLVGHKRYCILAIVSSLTENGPPQDPQGKGSAQER